MIDKDFCLSSYIAFRYIWKDGVDFAEGMQHENFRPIPLNKRVPVASAEDIDREIQRQIDALYEQYSNVGILLSGGMDSANLASYLRPGSHAYTFTAEGTTIFNADEQRAAQYCEKWGLNHHFVKISFDDFKTLTPIVMNQNVALFTPSSLRFIRQPCKPRPTALRPWSSGTVPTMCSAA